VGGGGGGGVFSNCHIQLFILNGIDKCINFDGIATFHCHVLKIFYLHVFMHNIPSIHNNATITRNKLFCWLKIIIVLENILVVIGCILLAPFVVIGDIVNHSCFALLSNNHA
jgi:hypothetical protein